MSRKRAYKQALSIGAAAVLGFSLFAGSFGNASPTLSSKTDEQAAAAAAAQDSSYDDDEVELIVEHESASAGDATSTTTVENLDTDRARGVYLSSVPDYAGNPYVALRTDAAHALGVPSFTLEEYERAREGCFKQFSKLDHLGRTRKALACVGPESLGTGKRGDISRIHPAGWRQARYDFIPGESLYNRCHLIAWSLSGENVNRKNLLTGTRYLNETGMLPFEEKILDYIRETGNHVLYRVTPMYNEDELVCRGVRLEAQSVEDHGESLCFHVYCYNLQPHVTIDYATGKSQASGD